MRIPSGGTGILSVIPGQQRYHTDNDTKDASRMSTGPIDPIRLALPSKGHLYDGIVELLKTAGYKVRRTATGSMKPRSWAMAAFTSCSCGLLTS